MARPKLEKNEKLSLSDWILFLNERYNAYQSYFNAILPTVTTFTVLSVAFFSLYINANQFVAFLITNNAPIDITFFNNTIIFLVIFLTGLSAILVIISLNQKYNKNSKFRKIADLYKSVMKGDIANPIEIKDKYFDIIEPKKKIKNNSDWEILIKASTNRMLSKLSFIISFFTIFFPLVVAVCIYWTQGKVDLILFSVPISLGFAIFSISLAFDSNAKMIDNANINFLQTSSDFVEARSRYISVYSNDPAQNLENVKHFLWWSEIHLIRAFELNKKIIKPEHQMELYNYFYVSLWQMFDIFKVKWNSIREGDRQRIIKMYSMARQYEKNPNSEKKLMTLFERHLGKSPNESEEKFYERIETKENVID